MIILSITALEAVMDRFVLTNDRAGDELATSWGRSGDELATVWRRDWDGPATSGAL